MESLNISENMKKVLIYIKKNQESNLGVIVLKISRGINLTNSTTTKICKKLEDYGFIVKIKVGRKNLIKLSEAGEELFKKYYN